MLVFDNPYWLFLIPALLPLLIVYYWRTGHRATARIRYSDISGMKSLPRGWTTSLRHIPFLIRLLVLSLLIIAMARPRAETVLEPEYTEGVDIVIALDVSGSMQAIDLDEQNKKNRLVISKEVIGKFVDGRLNDRIGLVIFASSAFTQCPMTIDYPILHQLLEQINIGIIDEKSTAIGNALANAVNRLRNSLAKSKVIILLTDGENNAGEIDPLTAAEIAKSFGIRVYTIGAGSEGTALVPVQTMFGTQYQRVQVQIDEKTLNEIATITGAKYYRAKNRQGLKAIFDAIDQLERTKIEMQGTRRYQELFQYAALPAFGFFLLELLLAYTRFRMLP